MKTRIRRGVSFLAAAAWTLAIVVHPSASLAAAGDLDPTFGHGGTVTTLFPGGSFANAVAIQPDGKIVAVGAAAGPSRAGEFAVARYLTDGSLDATFDEDGMLTTPVPGGGDEARSVAIQPNGRIVVVGTAGGRFVAIRYRANGTLDASFGGEGVVRTEMTPTDDVAYDVAIQGNGAIVAGGTVGLPRSPEFGLARYRPNGTLDPAFGDRGRAMGGSDSGRSLAIQPDGRIVLAGYDGWGTAVARYRANGTLDPTFGNGGWVRKVDSMVWPLAVALQANGKIVVAGDYDIFGVGLVRLTRDGRVDLTFGRRGEAHTTVGPGEQAISSLAIQRDGKIVGLGSAGPHEYGDSVVRRFILTRWLRDGTLDRSWSGDGKVQTHFLDGGAAHGAVIQSDGRIVAVGGAGASNAGAFAVARYLA